MTLKKSLAVTTAAALALSLAACSSDSSSDSSSSSSGSEGGDNYVLVNGTEPQNPLVPGNTNEVGGGRIVDSIFSGLVYYDVDGSPVNDVAESIELEGDKTYRITIKDGQTFTDGTPVTAESFVNAWNYNVANNTLSAYFFESILGYEEGVESMEGLQVVDDTTFTVELTQPESDFPLRLGYSAFFPLPDSALEDMAAFGENPVGNGPYKLLEWNHNQDATIVPNEDYDGGRAAQNDGIKFVFYPTFDSAYADLLSDNLDVLDTIPDSAFSTFEDELSGRSINQASAVFQSFTIPERLEHFSGEEGVLRRQAISLAINRDEITQTIFEGTRTPATDFTSPVIAGHSDSLTGADVLTYDPDRAKDLWAQADAINPWSGEFTISYNADGGHQAWADATANSIRNTLGIDALGNPYPDFKSLRDDVTNRTINGAFRTGWQADYPSLGNFLGPLYGTGAGSNDGDYSNPDFDAKLAEAANAADVDASTPLYNEAQEILLQDLPAIPTWYSNAVGGYSTNVDNVEFQWNSQPAYYQITKN
ncbi:peptide ABC transporter substrate-binding protein [Corynebacterium glutamicum]|uniref:peptide ABC transporter substrate-binding protein n=1 Tax=Corynebacterium glutamicum TaxID=1718 RepID=UPI0011984FEC|nr:ABC transporter substrate-binding protein [Corynebacterium glutamicum]QDX75891.1 ABC transporter substrate-binding protein [Corynebacterium glutamicum]QDX78662.1 ABC transporter substrate-binding protein [Corynebacterium glutamicum]TWS31837.1 ABC transporter substrate-binding protein [Corynebacterium glutamicum]TWS32789.1 ABC transporter substrate-binding protein [Corynebacterium glutamicum]TWS39523.1 ABC transporter substrate-binding protein [Corynebacterium glutamicum]